MFINKATVNKIEIQCTKTITMEVEESTKIGDKCNKLNFRGSDPGAVQFGNFINYYSFNSAKERLSILPEPIISAELSRGSDEKPFLVLDVGCNSGDFTQLLYAYLSGLSKRKIAILGIELDDGLIARAEQSNAHAGNVIYECVDVMESGRFNEVTQRFLSAFDKKQFDASFCLSITMWIHLNHRDEGLKEFLRKFATISELLVIEPQPWKCYLTAVKRLKKANESFPHFSSLQWRNSVEEDIQSYLETSLGRRMVHSTTPTKWNRKICFYSTVNEGL